MGGWTFSASSGSIDGAPQLFSLGRRLADPYAPGDAQLLPFCVHGATRSLKPCMCGSALVMGVRMHLPEAVFGGNRLVVTHEASGFRLSFSAEGALRCWARDSVADDHLTSRVAPANLPAWRQRMEASAMRTSTAVDWTFCCAAYAGDEAGVIGASSSADCAHGVTSAQAASAMPAPTAPAAPVATSGVISLQKLRPAREASPGILGVRPPAQADSGEDKAAVHLSSWHAHTGNGLDMDLLRQREDILWTADLPLYEDMLHDHGQWHMPAPKTSLC